MKDSLSAAFVSALALTLAACGETARLPFSATTGLEPTIPAPNRALIPTVNIAPAQGWPDGRHADWRPVGFGSPHWRAGWIIRAGCTCCPMAMCWWPKRTRPSGRRNPKASRAAS